jgi:hypothetical protein
MLVPTAAPTARLPDLGSHLDCVTGRVALVQGVSWKRALLVALIPFALVIAAGFVVLVVVDPPDPEKAGENVGYAAALAYVVGVVASWLSQTGRKTAGRLALLGIVLFSGAMIAGGAIGPRHGGGASRRLPAADRAPLVDRVVNGRHRLVHPTYGFSIAAPPPSYREAPELAAKAGFSRDPMSQYYVYTEAVPQAVLTIGLLSDLGDTREDFADGIRGAREAITRVEGAKIVEDTTTGTDGHLRAHVHVLVSGAHVLLDAYQIHPPGKPASAVMVMVAAADATALPEVAGSFQP